MLIMKSEEKRNRKNKTVKFGKHQNDWRKGNFQVVGKIGSRHHQTSGDERKKLKKVYLRRSRKLIET